MRNVEAISYCHGVYALGAFSEIISDTMLDRQIPEIERDKN